MQKVKRINKTMLGALLLAIAVLAAFISSFGNVYRADAAITLPTEPISPEPVERVYECKHTFYAVAQNTGLKISLTSVIATLYFSKGKGFGSLSQYTCTGGYVGDDFSGKNYSSYAKLYAAVTKSAAYGLSYDYVCYGSDDFTPSGYTFYFNENADALSDRTVNLSFSQEVLTFTVTFDTAGGDELTPLEVEGNTVPDLPTPTRAGYVFNGWRVPGQFGALVAYDENRPITANITLTASWKKLYVLSFDTAGGNEIESIEVVEGTAFSSLTLPTPTRASYDFAGWMYNGTSVAETQKVQSDMQLVAAWELHKPTVTFIVEGEIYAVVTIEQGTVFV